MLLRQLPADEPLLWLGLGSNLLVRDGGFAGTVIATQGALDGLEQTRTRRKCAPKPASPVPRWRNSAPAAAWWVPNSWPEFPAAWAARWR